MSFWSELKRRNVFKVAVAYLIVAWLIVQVVSIAFPAFHMPTWTVTFVMSLLIVGFPVVLIFAWAFEITPEGLKLTKDVPHHESITHLTGKKLNYTLAGVIVLALAYILFDNYYLDKRAIQTEVASRVAELAPPAVEEEEALPAAPTVEDEDALKTIAVLPFDDLSPDSDQGYFVDGLSEELLNFLAKIPDLSVTSKTSAFSFKDKEKTVKEIASVLGVDHILEGSVRKAGSMLRVTTQLIRAADDRHLWSNQYDRELKDIKDILSIQEDIAKAVANELKLTLGVGESLKQLGGTDNLEAYELYLAAKGTRDLNSERALELVNAAIAIDPEFASAWALKSMATFTTLQGTPANQYATMMADGINAAQKAIEIEPKLSEAYKALGHSKTLKGDWIGAERAYRKASELITEPSLKYKAFFGQHYLSVGDLERALEMNKAAMQKDPLSIADRVEYIYLLGLIGDRQQAEEEYKFGKTLFGDQWGWGDEAITLVRLLSTGNVMSRDEILMSDTISDVAKEYLESPEQGIEKLHQLYAENNQLNKHKLIVIVWWAAYFGDPVFAMDVMEKVVSLDACEAFYLWFPVMHEVRQLPRFKEFVREIGLVDYWNEFGWPDICRPLDNGDFVCD